MHKLYTLFFILILTVSKSIGQCVITCNQNVGVFSNNDPSTIGYDNMTSSFHSSVASEELGFRVWGENMLNIGTDHALSPIYINSTNYPALTGTVYFAGVGSYSINDVQLIVLTSTGLFASGNLGSVLSTSIKNTTIFSKITVNGKTDGLPFGITPDSVKMMFVSFQTIIITTCGGNVYVLSQYSNVRGDIGIASQWSQVKMANGQPLTGIIAARGNSSFAFALKNDNTLWTWGDQLRMGNGSATFNSNFAIQMTPPSGVSKIKMIQGTSFQGNQSYYVLDTNNKVFALGDNTRGQLADNTSVNRSVWVNCLYSSGGIVNNAKWISSNEHDQVNPNIGIINSNSQMQTAGNNSRWMIGRTSNNLSNNLNFPTGISPTDTIMFCEVGGHTSAFIKKNTIRYGYVGHHVNGSIGNNSASDNEITSVDFIIPPIISICGTVCDTPIISKKPFNCNDSIATFIIKGRRNNIVRFNINGVNDSVVIGNNDTAIISRLKPNGDLALNITQINSVYCNLSLAIKDTLKLYTKKDSFLTICRNKSVIFNQQVISNSGIFRDTLINFFGCDSFVNLFLTVLDTSKKDSFLTICQPNTIIFNNQTIGISGIYKDTLINSKGCDSILTLNLTVNPKTFGIINQSICQGNSFLFKGINRTISGTYLDTLINTKGCDSILTLNLTVNSRTLGTINQTICQGQSFLGRTISGTYIDTLLGANSKGCDSIRTLNLTVNPKTFGSINQTICQGSSFLFNGINRTISGAYLDTLINSKGCDSILTLNLTVNPKTFGTINQSICQGSSFSFNGINRTISGAYLDTLVNAKGCDSILTLNLTVNPKTFGTINQSICQGSSFLFNGINRTVSGAYLDTLVNTKGCDSILTLNLTVNPKTFGTINQSICQGTSFLFNGINRIISGTYLDTLLNIKGCDSILTLNLTVNTSTFGTINQTICQGQSFLGRTTSGTYIDTLPGANSKGCDSIRTLILIVNSKTFGSINQTICEGSSFLGRSTSGTYIDTLIGANAKGCDSILTLNLTVNPKTFGTINQTICQGSSFLFNGINQNVTGIYLDTLINAKGCDSILTLNLTVNPKTFGTINQTICEGNSFLFNGINRTVSGAYLDTLVNAKGCDSILTLNLTVNPKTFGTINQKICHGSSFLFNGINQTIAGAYLDTLINAKGCDSILTLNLTINPKTFGTINQTICEGNSFLFNGINRTVSGAYLDTLVNAKGCDSILTLNLTVNPKTFGTINHNICQGSSFLFNGINRTVSGAYIDTLVNIKGCDSIITLNLTVNPKTFGTINQTICLGQSFLGKTSTGTYIDTLLGANANGCDSIRTLILIVNTTTYSNFNQTICEGESFFNRIKSGFYSDTFVNALGCDSVRNLFLTVNPVSKTIINKTICEGDIFIGKSNTGRYLDTFKNRFGCDSIREINLWVTSVNRKTLNYSICDGESFRGRTKTGIFIDTIKNSLGCDSIIETVDLYVRPNIDSSFKVKICDGRSYRGKTTAGNYVDSFVNDYGCISIYRYELSLKVRSYNNEIKTICNDQKYKGYTKSGIYSDTFINQYGCDSIITLTLFVKPNFITQKLKDTTIKKGDSILLQAQKGFLYYTWNTKTTRPEIMVSEAGKYKVTIMNQDGCIAYDSCNVFMIPKDTSNSDTSIIDSIDGYAECPNIFTPNDDFKNDLFRPNFYGEVEVIRLMVYSRLGEKMFEGHGNFSAWDGYYKGEKCEPGVYIYIMEFKSKKGNHFVKGSITLLR